MSEPQPAAEVVATGEEIRIPQPEPEPQPEPAATTEPNATTEPTHTQPWQGTMGQWHFSDGSYMNDDELAHWKATGEEKHITEPETTEPVVTETETAEPTDTEPVATATETATTEPGTKELVRQPALEPVTPDTWCKLRQALSTTGTGQMRTAPAIRLLIAGYNDPIAHQLAVQAIKEHQLN